MNNIPSKGTSDVQVSSGNKSMDDKNSAKLSDNDNEKVTKDEIKGTESPEQKEKKVRRHRMGTPAILFFLAQQ